MNEYTPKNIMVDAQLAYPLRDPASESTTQLEDRARGALQTYESYSCLHNPYLFNGDPFASPPEPTQTEIETYRHTSNKLWLQSSIAIASLHQQESTSGKQQSGFALMEQITHALATTDKSITRNLLGDYYVDWLAGGSKLIDSYLATNQIDKAANIVAILKPHLDVTDEFNGLRISLERFNRHVTHAQDAFASLAPATIAVIAAA